MALLQGCQSQKPANNLNDVQSDNILTRISDAEIRGIDPQKFSDLASIRIAREQFAGLLRFDASGKAGNNGLARQWDISPDGLRYRFTLYDNIAFSDGTAITADMFARIWQRLHDPQTASPHIGLFDNIASITAEKNHIVLVTLKQPDPAILSLLAHPALSALPLHIIEKKGDDWVKMRPIISSGAWQLTQWRLNDRLTLSPNPHWRGSKPYFQKIIWRTSDDPATSIRLYQAGQADIIGTIPQQRFLSLQQTMAKALHSADYLGSYYMTLNTRMAPFNNGDVRTALNMAVNRQWLVKRLMPMGNRPAYSIVPPSLYPEASPIWRDWSMDRRLSHARALLEKAGYHDDNPLRFTIRINSSTEHKNIAAALMTMWRQLPVDAQMLNSEANLHFSAMRLGDFEMARSGWIADYPAAENFLSVHHSDAGVINYSGYRNTDYDHLLSQALKTPDEKRRLVLLRDAEKILLATPLSFRYIFTKAPIWSGKI